MKNKIRNTVKQTRYIERVGFSWSVHVTNPQLQINVRVYRRSNEKWTMQTNCQHMVHKTKKNKTKIQLNKYVLDTTIHTQKTQLNKYVLDTIIHTQKHNLINMCWTPLYTPKKHNLINMCWTPLYTTKKHNLINMCWTPLYTPKNTT
jgi:hypothetical protein